MGTTASSSASISAEGSSSDGAGVVPIPIISANNGAVAVFPAVDGSDREAADGDDRTGGDAGDGSDANPKDENEDEDGNGGGDIVLSIPILSKIATYAGHELYELVLDSLAPAEREEFEREYLLRNSAVPERIIALSVHPKTWEKGTRLLSEWIRWNETPYEFLRAATIPTDDPEFEELYAKWLALLFSDAKLHKAAMSALACDDVSLPMQWYDLRELLLDGSEETILPWLLLRFLHGEEPAPIDMGLCMRAIVARCNAGADVDARCGYLPSPREMARLAVASGDAVSVARGTLALAALGGKLDREDCYADMNVLYRAIQSLLFCRLGALVGPAVSAHHAVQTVVPATVSPDQRYYFIVMVLTIAVGLLYVAVDEIGKVFGLNRQEEEIKIGAMHYIAFAMSVVFVFFSPPILHINPNNH